MNKTDFFEDLSSHLSEPIYLTDKTDEVLKEIEHNHWILSTSADIASQIKPADFLEFIQQVKETYQIQLSESPLNIDLIFYLWFEEPGRLCFNFINSNHDKLPFSAELRFTDNAQEIIEQYLKSYYHDQFIPWAEFETLEVPEAIAETERLDRARNEKFVVMVYQEVIKKHM